MNTTAESPSYLILNSRDELLRLDIDSIVYLEADGNYTSIVTCNNLRGVVCVNLTQMQRLISERLGEKASRFARVGKRYIVNMTHVFSINTLRQTLTLSDGLTFAFNLSIGKEAIKELKHKFIIKTLN